MELVRRRRAVWIGILLTLSLAGVPRGRASDGTGVDLDAARAIAEKITGAAENLNDLVLLQLDHDRKADAQRSHEALRSLLDQLERLCDELDAACVALETKARQHVESGRADKALEALSSQKDVAELALDLRKHLTELRAIEKTFPSPGRPAEPRTKALRGLAAKWFGPRSGARRHPVAVRRGLDWLESHQDPAGHWDCDGFGAECDDGKCDGRGSALFDPGLTGLALLAFLGAGETHLAGSYRPTVKSGLDYLKRIQDHEGCFGPRTTNRFTYNHGCAALAMIEAYALTGSPLFKQSAQRALDFIEKCRNPRFAWRYGVRPRDNDTSVTAWMVSALFAARAAGLDVSTESLDGARSWIDHVTEPAYGKVGYSARGTGPVRPHDIMDKYPPGMSESLTAIGVLLRILLGESPEGSEPIGKGVDMCLKARPRWSDDSGCIDMYYWYYGAMALHQVGGQTWTRWRQDLERALLPHQIKGGCSRGSWDPVGPWGREGGRVYSTAICTLALETPLRHGRIPGR